MTAEALRPPGPGAAPVPSPPANSNVSRSDTSEKVKAAFTLTSLSFGNRCLQGPFTSGSNSVPSADGTASASRTTQVDDWTKKMSSNIKEEFQACLERILPVGIAKLKEKGLITSGPYTIAFRVDKTGLFVKVGEAGEEVQVKPEEFKGFWKTLPIFGDKMSNEFSDFQKFLSVANNAKNYVNYAGLGKRITPPDIEKEKTVAEAAAKAFKEIAEARSTERKEFIEKSFFQRHKEIFLALTNGGSALTNALSASGNPCFMMASGLFAVLKGSNFAVYTSTSFQEKKYLDALGIQKHDFWDKLYMAVGFLNGLLVAAAGLTLFLAGVLLEVGRKSAPILMYIHQVIGTYIFGYITANIFASILVIISGIRVYKVIRLRRELNSFLENKELTPKEKALGYLKKVKEMVELTDAEKEEIKSKIKAQLRKARPELSNASEEQLDKLFDEVGGEEAVKDLFKLRIMQKTNDKIEDFQKLANGDLIKEIFATEPRSDHTKIDSLILALKKGQVAKLKEANRLILAIDRATYQTLVCHLVYIGIAVLCLLGNLLILTTPWAAAIYWTCIALIYLAWDYSRSNLKITGYIYDHGFFGYGCRSKKTKEILGIEEDVIPMPAPAPERQPLLPPHAEGGSPDAEEEAV